MTNENKETDAEKDWAYRDSTKRLLWGLLLGGCALTVVLEFFALGRHSHAPVDWGFGFYAALGFICCSLMIFAAKGLGYILKVPTDFYGDEDDANDGEGGAE